MLNLDAIEEAVVQEVPFQWILFENLIPEAQRWNLANNYPQDSFYQVDHSEASLYLRPNIVRQEEIAKLNNRSDYWRKLIKDGHLTHEIEKLDQVWQRLIEEIWNPAYRIAMEKQTGLNLKNHTLTISFRRYNSGNTFAPHTDHPSKSLTHLLFFNSQWSMNWGGYFRILKGNQPDFVFQEIPPLINYSVAIIRSDNSWHMVTPVSADATQPRLTLQIAFWKDDL
ncbi:2OG-Fe(II) oxygenase [Scytonema sp. NUACC26]|uniref:2OG-Fe(II) oxygenase n=1 Tax=Scytonema sp. NUACC26 TaxID=3140176 RepID=UPI0034DBAD56